MIATKSVALAIALTATSQTQATDLRIDNVRLYQPHLKTFSAPSRLYIDDGKISAINEMSAAITSAENVVDGNNQFVIPGLIDLHVHLGASGSNYSAFQYLPVESHFNANLYLGVTSIVDLFSMDATINEGKELIHSQISPNFFYAGALFTNPGGHGTQFGGALEVTNDDAIESLWQQHLAKKPSITKAVIETFGGQGKSLTDSQLKEIGKRSKAAGLPYFVHVSTLADGKRAINAGATALAHGINSEPVDDEFIALMKQHQVAYIPTLAVYHNHNDEHQSALLSKQTSLLKTVPEKLQHCLFKKVAAPSKWKNAVWLKRQHAYKNIQALHQAGITIGTGSDAGNPYTLHGTGLHNEVQALVKSGLSPAEVINSATLNGAKIMGKQSKLGQLKTGYQASFILLNDNPLHNISALADINAVYKSGQKVNRPALVAKNQKIIPQGQECHVQAVAGKKVTKSIDDFTGETRWQAISDTMMGGQSTTTVKQESHTLSIETHLGTPTGFGAWAGTQLEFNDPVDATDYQGIKIKYRGSKVPFGLSVYHSDVKDWDHFSTQLQPTEEWQTVKIPFTELKQFGFGSPIEWSAKSLAGLSLVWRTMPGSKADANISANNNQLQVSEIAYF